MCQKKILRAVETPYPLVNQIKSNLCSKAKSKLYMKTPPRFKYTSPRPPEYRKGAKQVVELIPKSTRPNNIAVAGINHQKYDDEYTGFAMKS